MPNNEEKTDVKSSTNTMNNSIVGTEAAIRAYYMPEFDPNKDNFEVWMERLEIHFIELECENDETVKRNTLLKSMGSEAYGVVRSLCDPKLPKDTEFNDMVEYLKKYYLPTVIIFSERKKFYDAKKTDGESVTAWFTRVKKLAGKCKFGTNLDAVVLDKFVCGLPGIIFERLCEEDEKLTAANALKKALIVESKLTVKAKGTECEVNFVKKHRTKKSYNNKSKENNTTHGDQKKKKDCKHCGWRNHASESCRYKTAKCNKCLSIGHLANVCKSNNKSKEVNFIEPNKDSSQNFSKSNFFSKANEIDYSQYETEGQFGVYMMEDENEEANGSTDMYHGSRVYVLPVGIDGVELSVACDTGAPLSLMSIGMFDKLYNRSQLKHCKLKFTNYSGNRIPIVGEFFANVTYRGQTKKISFVVTDTRSPPLLSRNFLRKFNFELVQSDTNVNTVESKNETIEQIKTEFKEVFDGKLGAYKLSKINLPIDKNAKPVFCKPRTVPFAWKTKIEKQLNDLVENGVLVPVNDAKWGTPLVPLPKPNGEIRICGDYKVTLNKYLNDFKYPLPRIEEIFASLQGGILFTKLDLSNAYNQLILDDESQDLCSWSTHIGTFKMTRLPFGVKPAAPLFQKTIENLIRGIPNVINYLDDIVVTGPTLKEHVNTLRAVLNKLTEAGLKLNLTKCAFFQEKINYLGFCIDKDGLSKTKERIKSVVDAPIPKDISELRAFLGMVNYYSKFINNFSAKMAPLYDLLKKDNIFDWNENCQSAYEAIKIDVTSDQVLVHFNPEAPLILETDASQNAIAGVLSHLFSDKSQRPIAFVSRSLTSAERNYSVIEKEALAIIFSVVKLRQYLIGMHFELATDHKPLLAIFGENKGLPIMASARMQRWAFILSGFSYSLRHIKGVSNPADVFSRMPQASDDDTIKTLDCSYIMYADFDNVLQLNFKNIAVETRRDPILSKVLEAINFGTVLRLTGTEFEPFRHRHMELSVESDCILWGYRTVIPTKLREKILQILHQSHLGIVKTKSLARSYVWWPKLDFDIEQLIKGCESCHKVLPNPERSELISWEPTDSVWSRIHIDYAGPIKGFYFLIIVDSFSKWVEVFKTTSTTSAVTIKHLRETFCRFGLAEVIASDNGTQLTSEEFKKFVAMNGIRQILIPPGHPASNGQAENSVKTFKKSIYANLYDKKPENFEIIINRFLADYRATKHCSTKETPFKLMFNREMRTRFNIFKPPTTRENILESQQKAGKNFKGHRETKFNIDDIVIIRDYSDPNNPSWEKAIISEVIGPRSYLCKMVHNGRNIKRHLDQIRGIVEKEPQANVDTEIELCSASGAAVTKRDSTAPMDATAIVDETMKDDTSLPKKAKKPKRTAHRMKLRSRKNNKNINK